jgi:transposase
VTVVIGVDPHKQTHTAVAVRSGTGEVIDERTAAARTEGHEELLSWAQGLSADRLWALEDVRSVSRGLERLLVARGERVVRVPPKLMAGARRGARSFGKSDRIDALAIARAGLGHPDLPIAVEDQEAREIKLLVDHRETLVRQRTEAQDRLRWLLHAVDPEMTVPAGALDRKVWLDRVERRLARAAQCVEVRIARDLVARCRALTVDANELEREIALRVASYAPQLLDLKGCGTLIAGKLIGETGGIGRFRTDAQLARLAGVAPLDASSGQQRRHRLNRHGNRQLNTALHKLAVVQGRWDPRARAYLEPPAGRRQDPTRSAALPQATVGTRRIPPPAPDAPVGRPCAHARRTAPAGCDTWRAECTDYHGIRARAEGDAGPPARRVRPSGAAQVRATQSLRL